MSTQAISVNPANGQTIATMPWATADELERVLSQAAAGFAEWKQTTVSYRAQKLRDTGAALRSRSEEMAQMIAPKWASQSNRPVEKWQNRQRFVTGMQSMVRQC